MAQPNFPQTPTEGQHFVQDNKLWVYTSYTDENGDIKYRWVLWGNLTYVGVPGDPGLNGEPGQDGATGATGPRGHRGPTGPVGDIGATGPQGEAGTSLRLMGRYTSFSKLWELADMKNGEANPAVTEGDMYVIEDGSTKYDPDKDIVGAPDNEAWVYSPYGEPDEWDIAPWISVGPIQGPVGPDGEDGDIGPTGPRGETGATGPAGLNGAHGGAFAHMVDVPPTRGPAGKIYMVKGDWAMYVTTGK